MRRKTISPVHALLIFVAIALVGTACGSGSTDAGGGTSTTAASEGSTTTNVDPQTTTDYELWFAYGDKLFVTSREGPSAEAAARTAVELLLEGPSGPESDAAVATLIPEGTELRDISLKNGVATVDLSSEFESGGGSLSMLMRLGQVVHTLTQFGSIDGVDFRIEGEPVETFSSEGIVLESPQTRKDYEELLPQILVEQPLVGQVVTSPVTVSGTANTFEATVSIRIVTADGDTLKETFTTATCGSGCRGDYSKNVAFDVDKEQPGFVEVYESSAEDGSAIHMIRIPVALAP